jgi:hypothetical protein
MRVILNALFSGILILVLSLFISKYAHADEFILPMMQL